MASLASPVNILDVQLDVRTLKMLVISLEPKVENCQVRKLRDKIVISDFCHNLYLYRLNSVSQ